MSNSGAPSPHHFPFAIFDLSFVIAAITSSMANDKSKKRKSESKDVKDGGIARSINSPHCGLHILSSGRGMKAKESMSLTGNAIPLPPFLCDALGAETFS
ncbi:MAG: hypothetical protein ACREEM_05200 [Blastocatellia bacterium]